MNFDGINHICALARRAKRIRVRRGYFGDCSIQISYGPLGLLRKTYRLDFLSFDAIRNRVRMQRVAQRVVAKFAPQAIAA
jgi:hypothetical protein